MDATLAAWLPCAPPSLRGALSVGPSLRGLPILTVSRRVPRGAIALSSTLWATSTGPAEQLNGERMSHGHGHWHGHHAQNYRK